MPLYKFYWNCGRMGFLDGVFEATEEDVQGIIGKDVDFGEVLGKHSEIHGEMEEDDITLVTDDQGFIDKAKGYGLIPTGYNPFDYFEDDEEDD